MFRSLLHIVLVDVLLNYVCDLLTFPTKLELWSRLRGNVARGLRATGLGQLWGQALFHVCLFRDLILLARAQKEHDPRRERLRFSCQQSPQGAHSSPITSSRVSRQDLHLGEHYARYALGVYGKAAIVKVQNKTQGKSDITRNDTYVEALQKYVNAQAEDVWYADYSFGESSRHIRHAVVVDHSTQKVVLTIRGTRSITSALVSLDCFSKPFAGGQAHGGAADMALAIWEATGPMLERKIATLPKEYGLVLTGHSLGGAVASLITIHLYALRTSHKLAESLHGRSIQCYTYGPLSCFTPCTAAPEAVQNTLAFVHNMDVVPSISVHCMRLLFAQVFSVRETARRRRSSILCSDALATARAEDFGDDNPPVSRGFPYWASVIVSRAVKRGVVLVVGATQTVAKAGYSFWRLLRDFVWYDKPAPPKFRQALERTTSDEFTKLDAAPMLEIPARVLVWLEQVPPSTTYASNTADSSSPSSSAPLYEVHGLNPHKYADRPAMFSSRMMADHLCTSYATVFDTVRRQQQEQDRKVQ